MINERWWMEDLYRLGWRCYLKIEISKCLEELRYLWQDKVVEETDHFYFIRNKTPKELRHAKNF